MGSPVEGAWNYGLVLQQRRWPDAWRRCWFIPRERGAEGKVLTAAFANVRWQLKLFPRLWTKTFIAGANTETSRSSWVYENRADGGKQSPSQAKARRIFHHSESAGQELECESQATSSHCTEFQWDQQARKQCDWRRTQHKQHRRCQVSN